MISSIDMSIDISEITPYNFKEVEEKWRSFWLENHSFKTKNDSSKPKCYVLEMFMYPSGKVHIGHIRNYTIGDIIARYKMAQGFDVLHPVGWDAFGLPAENAALQHKSHPKNWTYQNIKIMKKQIQSMGFSYDWDREIETCNENYYGFQQKIFLKMYEKGLIYRKEAEVNWDPVDNCVLANEQVIDGRGWRSGALVKKKMLPQWFFKITNYAEELLSNLNELNEWSDNVKTMQKNWIGKSEGCSIDFHCSNGDNLEIFSTRPETLFGATYLAISPKHPLAKKISKTDDKIKKFLENSKIGSVSKQILDTQEKIGIDTGLTAKHPFLDKQLPIYIANFVLMDYGTGAIFACPAHDKRDYDFAIKYKLPIQEIITPQTTSNQLPYEGDGLIINSDFLNGLTIQEARNKIIKIIEEKRIGTKKIFFKLRDWGISRQRYWGCPIPIVYCPKCGIVPLKEENLPVILPEDVTFENVCNPLVRHIKWKQVNCPICGEEANRETDTLDTFFDSSWYFLYFCSEHNNLKNILNKQDINHWMPVDHYIGGIEHAILHLLYARFFTKALADCNIIDLREPFKNLFTQGMVCCATYRKEDGEWLFPNEVQQNKEGNYETISTKEKVIVGHLEKMSKSKKNVVDPDFIVETYGADALRLFVVSDTPPERDFPWSDEGLEGCWKFINRIWRMFIYLKSKGINASNIKMDIDISSLNIDLQKVYKNFHKTIKDVTESYENKMMNKAVAFLRELVNNIYSVLEQAESNICLFSIITRDFIKLLAPITPHICQEAWQLLGFDKLIHENDWPKFDKQYLTSDVVNLPIQVNGKLRGNLEISTDYTEEQIFEMALNLSNVKNYIGTKTIRKKIYVKGKIVNFVI